MSEAGIDYAGLVKRIRDAKGLTQEAFARLLEVTFSTVNTWENGRHRPQRHFARRLLELAKELGVDMGKPEEVVPHDPAKAKRSGPKRRGKRKNNG